jgi:hypothetical protein
MSFFETLWSSPPATPVSRFTMWDGVFYALLAGTFVVWPGASQTLFMAEPFVGHEKGLTRAFGAFGLFIGLFYVMGARTRPDSFVLFTVFNRVCSCLSCSCRSPSRVRSRRPSRGCSPSWTRRSRA